VPTARLWDPRPPQEATATCCGLPMEPKLLDVKWSARCQHCGTLRLVRV